MQHLQSLAAGQPNDVMGVSQDPWVMVAEKGNEKSGVALAALVRALHNKKRVAVILFLPRVSEKTGGNPTVCAGTPVLVRA